MTYNFHSEETKLRWTNTRIKNYAAAREKAEHTRDEYYKNPIRCLFCLSPIKYESRLRQKFCSHKCAYGYQLVKNGAPCGVKKIRYCHNCTKELTRHQSKYCSHKCQVELKDKLWMEDWKLGKELGRSGLCGTSAKIRKYLFKKYESKCCECGWSKVNLSTGKIPLQIEHIDGNYKNNREENLKLLCPNCHSLTSTFGVLNKGKGREYRRHAP